ncbi:MAG: hypothetical protein COW65_12565 [Cytophagales bacterium CG18_big_fil_WC_8_21_14_2_50_42_9]|nr:MAG: hypothetical protein COW65_12565 [Cytophagales bacterium CG18_big_fil_WC_8_21_14_2_50_42_9]
MVITTGVFSGKTVAFVLAEANKKLAGCYSPYSFSELNDALSRINESFVDGIKRSDFLTCSTTRSVIASQKAPDVSELLVAESEAKLSAFPNPYTDKATIEFTLKEAGDYTLELHDVSGRVVKHISKGKAEANKVYSFKIGSGSMSNGIYMARLTTGKFNKVIRISLIR